MENSEHKGIYKTYLKSKNYQIIFSLVGIVSHENIICKHILNQGKLFEVFLFFLFC